MRCDVNFEKLDYLTLTPTQNVWFYEGKYHTYHTHIPCINAYELESYFSYASYLIITYYQASANIFKRLNVIIL